MSSRLTSSVGQGRYFTGTAAYLRLEPCRFALVCTAVLLGRSLWPLAAIDRGFEPTRAATFQLQLAPTRFPDAETQLDFVPRALEALRTIPAVQAAGLVSDLPFSGSRSSLSRRKASLQPRVACSVLTIA